MYTQEMMTDAIQSFSENPYWKEYYDTAPSVACKTRIAFNFCSTDYGIEGYFESKEDFWAERKRLEAQLDLADWKHLLKYSGNNPWRGKCMKEIKELEEGNNNER